MISLTTNSKYLYVLIIKSMKSVKGTLQIAIRNDWIYYNFHKKNFYIQYLKASAIFRNMLWKYVTILTDSDVLIHSPQRSSKLKINQMAFTTVFI